MSSPEHGRRGVNGGVATTKTQHPSSSYGSLQRHHHDDHGDDHDDVLGLNSVAARPDLRLDVSTHAASSAARADQASARPAPSAASAASQLPIVATNHDPLNHPSGPQPRSYSHTRSQSLSETVRPPPARSDLSQGRHSYNDPTVSLSSSTSDPNAPSSSSVFSSLDTRMAAQADLVRRHHTLSTSSSRLVRLERSRARLALQGVGLSEEDQEYYVPPSPIRGSLWSDLGHDGSNAAGSSFGAVGSRHSLAVGEPSYASYANSGDRSREPSNSASASQVAAVWEQDEPPEHHGQQPSTQSSIAPIAGPVVKKRSSFVVLRGAKGDAALTERRSASSTTPTSVVGARPVDETQPTSTGSTELKHRNSLKPFLDAEGAGDHEEWERGLQDERDREEMQMRRGEDQYAPDVSTFAPLSGGHSRASTYQQPSSDPWNPPEDDSGNPIRRHQSLNNFRSRPIEATSDMLSTSASTSVDGWGSHSRLASASSGDETLYGSLALSSSASGSFARSRSGTSPTPVNLQHSSSLRSQGGGSTPHSNLSHSNSLSSHHSHPSHSSLSHSNSLTRERGSLSPVGGFSRSPWSPTVEETKQLGSMTSVVVGSGGVSGLNRGGSGSSRGSAAGRFAAPESGLAEEFVQLDIASNNAPYSKATTPPSFYGEGYDSRGQATSPRPLGAGVGRSVSGPQGPPRRLPALSTNLEQATVAQQQSAAARHGPASAAAFVPPIGHSHAGAASPFGVTGRPHTSDDYRGTEQTTAMPGGEVGTSSYEWQRQKELLMGGGEGSWPTGPGVGPSTGYGVTLAMQQQQQQIQLLQTQMQQATEALNMMRHQGAPIPMMSGVSGVPGVPYPAYSPAPPVHARATSQPRQPKGSMGPSELLPAPIITSNGVGGTAPGTTFAAFAEPAESPIDVPSLVAKKGYNPVNFDLRPQSARFFVIKSYTEEDVHKSLKHEIWASTDLGNKRLDRAFRESNEKGPIYLFFSVNASGHFAGVAEMLTPVDYATTSTVWASDKWKGVLKVRWIYIKDVPLAALRHIRLNNTSENKPVTSSRDTQEVPYDAGLEVLRVIATYPSRTSLLQDYGYYEARMTAAAGSGGGGGEDEPRQSTAPATDEKSAHNPHYSRMAAANQQQQGSGGNQHGYPRRASPAPASNPYASPQQPPHHHHHGGASFHPSPGYYGPQNHGQFDMSPPAPMMPQQPQGSPQQAPSNGKNGAGVGRRFYNPNAGPRTGPSMF